MTQRKLWTAEFKEFPTEIVTSVSRKPKYFKLTDKLPKKYQTKQYMFKAGYLTDMTTNEKVIKNPLKVGKPKTEKIAGNKIWAGIPALIKTSKAGKRYISPPYYRIKVAATLKAYFSAQIREHLKKGTIKKITKFPIIFESEIHHIPGKRNWDMDNLSYITLKMFQDCLISEGVIPNDSIQYITKPPTGPLYCPVMKYEDRKIVISAYQDERKEVSDLKITTI